MTVNTNTLPDRSAGMLRVQYVVVSSLICLSSNPLYFIGDGIADRISHPIWTLLMPQKKKDGEKWGDGADVDIVFVLLWFREKKVSLE